MYPASQKTGHPTFTHNFARCWLFSGRSIFGEVVYKSILSLWTRVYCPVFWLMDSLVSTENLCKLQFVTLFNRQRSAEGAVHANNRQEVMVQGEGTHAVAGGWWLSTTSGVGRPRRLPAQVLEWSRFADESCRHVWLSAARLCHRLLLVCLPLAFTEVYFFCIVCSVYCLI